MAGDKPVRITSAPMPAGAQGMPAVGTPGLVAADGPDLVVVGSISTDRLRIQDSPAVCTVGGAGLYASLGAAAAGARVGLVGLVGQSVCPATTDRLRGRVDLRGLMCVPGAGPHFDIAYDNAWRAGYAVDDAQVERLVDHGLIPEHYRWARGFHLCPLGSPAGQLALATALRAAAEQRPVVLSATTFRNRITSAPMAVRALWGLVDVLVCSAEEACLLTGQAGVAAALDRIRAVLDTREPDCAVCVTDGAAGAHLVTRGGVRQVAAYPVRVLDPTGAGECFAGALLAAYLAGADLQRAAATGAAAASFAVEGLGPDRILAAVPGEVCRRTWAVAEASGLEVPVWVSRCSSPLRGSTPAARAH